MGIAEQIGFFLRAMLPTLATGETGRFSIIGCDQRVDDTQ
jgi:hypothetical protein